MLQSLTCPKCGAPLEAPADEAAMLICPFCNTPVELPRAARAAPPAPAERPVTRLSLNWREWTPLMRLLVIFIIVTVVLPACLGLAGSCLGIAAGFLGPLLAVLLPLFIK